MVSKVKVKAGRVEGECSELWVANVQAKKKSHVQMPSGRLNVRK